MEKQTPIISIPQQKTPASTANKNLGDLRNFGLFVAILLAVFYILYRLYHDSDFYGSINVNDGTFVVTRVTKNVGVKTSNPTTDFEVNGEIKTVDLQVTENTYLNTLEVTGLSELTDLDVSTRLQVPVDSTPGSATEGALQFSTGTNSLQVYKTSDGWVEVGGKIPIAETMTNLISGVDDPLIVSTFEASFTATVTVNSEATFNAATAAAAENTRIQLTTNITCASSLTIPNKALWIDLNGFTLTMPMSAGAAITCQQSLKNIYFSNGTIQYTSGTTGSSSTLITASNCNLYIRNVTLLHAEYAVTITGSGGNRLIFYTSGCTYSMVKARSSNNNSYGPIGLFGMVTDDSYIYVRSCTFDTFAGDTYPLASTDSFNFRGVVRCSSGTHLAGSCTITGCTINPAHRMQAVFYSDAFASTGTRGTFRLRIDKNTIGTAGEREQLILIFGYKPLNCFGSIYMMENTFLRMDSNKGIMYLDNNDGGSTDVYIFNNTVPTMKSVAAITFSSTYTRSGTTVNIVTPTPHNFTTFYAVTISGSVGGLSNGSYKVQTIVSPTEFTITDAVSGSASGTTTVADTYATSLRKLVSKDGYVRGPSTLTTAYLQKYNI